MGKVVLGSFTVALRAGPASAFTLLIVAQAVMVRVNLLIGFIPVKRIKKLRASRISTDTKSNSVYEASARVVMVFPLCINLLLDSSYPLHVNYTSVSYISILLNRLRLI